MLRSSLARAAAMVAAYTDHADSRVRLANRIALLVASNLPFYPLYVHLVVGRAGWPAWFGLLTAPGFAAVPAVARRHPLAGRVLLPVVGTINTLLCTKALGAASGVELFFIPCALLAAMLFRARERLVAAATVALPYVCYFLLDSRLGAPMARFTSAEHGALIALNAVSVASLTVLIGYLFASAEESGSS